MHPIEVNGSEIQKPNRPQPRVKTVQSTFSCISYSDSSPNASYVRLLNDLGCSPFAAQLTSLKVSKIKSLEWKRAKKPRNIVSYV